MLGAVFKGRSASNRRPAVIGRSQNKQPVADGRALPRRRDRDPLASSGLSHALAGR
jgi:hypothetical protein